MKKKIFLASSMLLLFSIISVAQNNPADKPEILNGIKTDVTKGIKLRAAYLFFDDDSDVPETNVAALNQNVNLAIIIERGGWVEKDSIVSIGASEKITSSDGKVLLNEPDLFAKLKDINADDAQYITLKAVITSMSNEIEYFTVNFTVWDKWGTGKITGSYKFYIK